MIPYNGLSMSKIREMDEVPLTFDAPPNCTVSNKGEKTIITTWNEKNRFTVILACLADGTKLAPMVIFKLVTMPPKTNSLRGLLYNATRRAG